jgi:putative ABC transport system permease protein
VSGGTWLGVVRTASGGLLRHKVQSVVIGAVLLVATASATLGIALLAATDGPFTHAFAAQRGADVAVTVNTAHATEAELAATRHASGVTAVAGPFAEATVATQFQGQPNGQLTLAGRSAPGGPADDLVLTAGHWVDGPGQVVLDGYAGGGGDGNPVVGSTLRMTSAPGEPSLTVVGFANSITTTADGWVTPGEIVTLRPPGTPSAEQVLYRFAQAGGYPQVRADVSAITRALPAGAVAGAGSWLTAQAQAEGNGAIMEPFVVAFALIGLAMAVLIVGNVVSGAVIAQYQRIGVLKCLGLTPAQVVAVYVSRVGWPALAGCLTGVVAGDLLASPVLHKSAGAYGVGSQQVLWWDLLIAPAGMLYSLCLPRSGRRSGPVGYPPSKR